MTSIETTSLDVAQAVGELIEAALAVSLLRTDGAADAVEQTTDALAVVLEAWLGEAQQYLAATIVSGLEQPLMERLTSTHDALHANRE